MKFFLLESRIQKILLVESRIQGFGIQNAAQGIRNPTKDWNPKSKFYNQVAGIRKPRRVIQNPRLSWIPLSHEFTKVKTFLSFVPHAPKFPLPLPLLTPATQANFCVSESIVIGKVYCKM